MNIEDAQITCEQAAQSDQTYEAELEKQQHQAGYELVENLTANINSLANLDLSAIGNNINLQHLLRATNHLKIAQNEFEMARKQLPLQKHKSHYVKRNTNSNLDN